MIENEKINTMLENLVKKSIEKLSDRIEYMIEDHHFELEQIPDILNNLSSVITLIEGTIYLDKLITKTDTKNDPASDIVKFLFTDMSNMRKKEETEIPKKKRIKKDDE